MKVKQKKIYCRVNIIVVLLAVAIFVWKYCSFSAAFQACRQYEWILLIGTVILVHCVKAIRLYFELYEKKLAIKPFIKQYCKVIVVSLLFPFKMGDIFRAYCYGYELRNYYAGAAIILIDRYVDIVALITTIALSSQLIGGNTPNVFYLLLAILLLLTGFYLIFPGMSDYWRKYFIQGTASERSIHMLQFLEHMEYAYQELNGVVKGKILIAYLLSMVSWFMELGSLVLISKMNREATVSVVTEYLTGALTGTESIYLNRFVIASVVLLLSTYLCIRVILQRGEKSHAQ